MANLDKDQVIADFTKAYTKANGQAPTIEAKSGWYSVDGGKNVRLAQLQEMTEAMSGQSATAETPAKQSKPAPTVAKKTKTPKSKGFSVKAFYAEQLKDRAPGATLPR
jgi:hypothetical protein